MPLLEKSKIESIPLKSRPRKSRGWLITSLCLITALTVAVVTLSVNVVMRSKEYQQQFSLQAQTLSDLQQQLAALQTQQQTDAARLEEQDKTIAAQQATLAERDKQIRDLQTQIALLEGQEALNKMILAQLSGNVTADSKLVALTFDDGPGPYTAQLLDAMKQRGIPGTFFVLGQKVDQYPALIQRMAAEGHVVGNHSYGHQNLKKLSPEGIRSEMDACSARIEQLIGHQPLVMRCPGGNYNDAVKAYAAEAKMPIIQWDVDTRDWESRDVNAILTTTFEGRYRVQDGSIVLMHDIYGTTLEASIQMMDRLLLEGYTFVTVPQLLALRGGIRSGEVYTAAYKMPAEGTPQ